MPDILIRRTLAALETVAILGEGERNWRFRRCPYARGLYTILVTGTHAAAGARHSVLIGTTEVVQESDTSNIGPGGAARLDGGMPVPNDTPAHQFIAEGGDEINLQLREIGNVATTDIMIWANVEPAG